MPGRGENIRQVAVHITSDRRQNCTEFAPGDIPATLLSVVLRGACGKAVAAFGVDQWETETPSAFSSDVPQITNLALGLAVGLPSPAVVTTMGASGAGKSTLARAVAAIIGAPVISYDDCRKELVDDPNDQSATAAAVNLAHNRASERCRDGLSTVLDGTHTTAKQRRNVLTIAWRHRMPAVLLAVATDLDTCLERQLQRAPRLPGALWGSQVPPDVVAGQHKRVRDSLATLHTEGWHAVHILNLTSRIPR